MKRLYLLRHASPEARGDDETRALTPLGRSEARVIGRALGELPRPELTLCSTATRAVQTLDELEQALGIPLPSRREARLYLASESRLLAFIEEQDDAQQTLMLVGHNPGMSHLAHALALRSEDEARAKLVRGLAPATLVALRFECEGWMGVGPGTGQVERILRP